MNKDVHDMDDLFRSVLDEYSETPSAGVKERLEATLDKKDAELYRKKYAGLKKTVLLLLLLVTGFVLYESGIFKTGTVRSRKMTDDNQQNYVSGEKSKKAYQKKIITDDTNDDDVGSYNRELVNNKVNKYNSVFKEEDSILSRLNKNDLTVPAATVMNKDAGSVKSNDRDNILSRRNSLEKDQQPGKQHTPFPQTDDLLQKVKIHLRPSLHEINTISIPGLTRSLSPSPALKDPFLKNNIANNIQEQRGRFFRPFWMFTAFASYERAGYRLDSDLPNNITTIKHSEIHEPSFSLGMLATRQLKERWGLQTGLIYSQTDIGISPQKLYALQNTRGDVFFKYITSSGYAYIKRGLGTPAAIGDSLVTKEGKHSLKFVSIPLVVKYSVGKNKLSFTPGAGIEANLLTSAKVETELESPSNPEIILINKLDGAKPFYLSVVADAELRYRLNSKLSASFRPTIRLAVSPVTENNVVETFPHSVGLGIGLTWKL